ncbi:pyruvate kinase PKM-like [Rhincodon typus]|uniref:pyruvate kinase PKM-like n=1 Tax=Rhincodon typus TaxID=259920 RepID=UPI00202F8806|nr:pyruvate kinase PKM-like [Rhincodon typus]
MRLSELKAPACYYVGFNGKHQQFSTVFSFYPFGSDLQGDDMVGAMTDNLIEAHQCLWGLDKVDVESRGVDLESFATTKHNCLPYEFHLPTVLFVFRSAHLVSRYRPRAPIIAVTREPQTARQAHLYRGIFPVLFKPPADAVWSDDVDHRVNFAMEVGKARGFFKSCDLVIVLTGWRPGSGSTNTMRVLQVP